MPLVMEPLGRHRSLLGRLAPLAVAVAALALALAPAGASATCSTNFAPAFGTNSVCAVTDLAVNPNPVDPGVAATFDGTGSTGDTGPGDIATYHWDFGDGSTADTAAPTATTTHAYARGRYVATLTTYDNTATPIATSAPVDVYACAMPVAAFSAPAATVRPGVAFTFDASASNAPDAPIGSIASYHWDWGDGTTTDAAVPAVQHTFAADGASTGVTLTVTNDLGLASAPVSHAITVQDQLPAVQLVATPSTVNVGQTVSLSAAGSVDPDGAIAEYRWDLDANGSFETSTGTGTSVSAGPFPNAGVINLRVKAIDDSGEATIRGVNVTVVDPTGGTGVGGGPGGGSGSGGSGGSGGGGSGGSGGSSGSGGSGGSGGASTGAPGDPFVLGLSGTAIQRLAAVLRHGVGLKAQANRLATGTLTLTISPTDARKLHLASRKNRRPVTIGTLRVSLRPGHATKPTIKLIPKAARALRHAKVRSLRVTVQGTLAAGPEHTTALRVILLRR